MEQRPRCNCFMTDFHKLFIVKLNKIIHKKTGASFLVAYVIYVSLVYTDSKKTVSCLLPRLSTSYHLCNFQKVTKMPSCRHTGRLMSIYYVLNNLNWLVFVFLSNLIINLMYNIIKNCTLMTSTSSEFKNDFDKRYYYSRHSKHNYLTEKTCGNEVCITSPVKHRHPVCLPTFLHCSKTGMFVIY